MRQFHTLESIEGLHESFSRSTYFAKELIGDNTLSIFAYFSLPADDDGNPVTK